MGQPVVHFEVIGDEPEKLRSFYGELFDWEFDTNAPVSDAVSEAGNYGFVDRYTAGLLPHFDGERRLEDVLVRAATDVDLDPGDRERFLPAALPVVKRLLELGFLLPADR